MPKLEVLSRAPATGSAKSVPLLFVHGAFCAAWIWETKFMPWFADRGWEVHAVSLRGHGESEGSRRLHEFGIDDYVDDVLDVAGRCTAPPVLIGHSMGGMVAQRAMGRRKFPATVLMASVPPHGLWEASMALAWRDPYVFQQMSMLMTFGTDCVDPEAICRAMFSDRMSRAEAAQYAPFLQEESRRVLLDIGGWVPFPPPPDYGVPVLVLGAGKDLLMPPDQVRATARAFVTDPVFFPDMGHGMMLETGWEEVAAHIADWLDATFAIDARGRKPGGT
jgi:pimeloyl-ACP methyl ester carboxylesterase